MGSVRFDSDEITLRRRNPVETALAVLLVTVVPVLAVLLAAAADVRALALVAPLAIAAGVHRFRKNARAIERLGRLSIGPLGVFFDGRRLGSSQGLSCAGVAAPYGDAPVVRLKTQGLVFEVRVASIEEARRLVDALTPSPHERHRIRLPSRVMSQPGLFARMGLYSVLLTLAFPIIGLAWHRDRVLALGLLAMSMVAAFALIAGLMADTVVELGETGLRIAWLGRQRLLPYTTIASVRVIDEAVDFSGTRTQRHLAIALKSGEVIRLPTGEVAPEALQGLLASARRALSRASTPAEVAVQSRGLGARAWLDALRGLAGGAAATLRTAPVSPEVLFRVVEDPDASGEARAGAAVALLSTLGDDARTRVRIAALGAVPKIRIALEAAADSTTEAELEQVLADVAEPASRLAALSASLDPEATS